MARMPAQNMLPGRPAKPPGLTKETASAWDRIIAELEESGIAVSTIHGYLVTAAATIITDMADAAETVRIEKAYILNAKTGATQLHPAARRLDSLRRDLVKTMSLLGLRTPVGAEEPEQTPQEAFEEALG